MKTNQWKLQNACLMKKRSDAQRNTSWVNIHDARHYQHSCRSYSNQPIKYYKESSDWWLHDPKEHKEEQELRENWLKVCYLLHIIHPQSMFPIFLITFLNSDTDLLDLTKLGNLFQIKDPRKCAELVPWIAVLAGGMKSTGPRLKLYGTFLYLKYDHMNWGFKVPVLLYISVNKNRKCCWWRDMDTLLLNCSRSS